MAVLEMLAGTIGAIILIGIALKIMKEGSIANYQFVIGMLLSLLVVGTVLPGTIMNMHFNSPFGDGGSVPTPTPGTPLLTCQELSTGIYYLSDDVDVNGANPCFNFSTSDVVLDCDFHALLNATHSDTAIAWYDVNNITVENCDIWDFQTGIEVVNSTDFEIYDNQLGENYNGISVTDSIGLISFNQLINNTGAGIYLEGVNASGIILNYLEENYDGIQAEYGNLNTFASNYAVNNSLAGYSFLKENGSVFTNNDGDDNGGAGGYGFYLYNTTLNTFDNNTILTSTSADFYCEEIPVGVDEDTGDNVCDTATTCTWMGIDGGGASPLCGANST